MTINLAEVKTVKYPPELLPDTFVGNLTAGTEYGTPMINLTNFSPLILELTKIQTLQNANVEMRIRYDNTRVFANTGGLLPGYIGKGRYPALQQLYLNYFSSAAVTPHTSFYSLWVYPPSIAHKIFWGIKLTDAEKVIDKQLGITESVQKGMLPLPISEILSRQYEIMGEETHTFNQAVGTTKQLLENLIPRSQNEFLVLTRIAAAPGTVVQDIQFIVDRDQDANLVSIPTYPLSLTLGGEVECFIPALQNLTLSASATAAVTNFFRYTFLRVRLSNILRLKFGLITKDQLGDTIGTQKAYDLAAKVQAGLY